MVMSQALTRKTAAGYLAVAGVIALAASLLPVRYGESMAAGESGLSERVRRIEDEKQIHDVIIRYGQYHDASNYAAYSQLFAKEGEWTGLLGELTTIRGPENIRAAMEKAFADRKYDPKHITNLHLVSNIRIDVDADRATGYSRWTVLSRNEKDEPYVRLSGRYEDVFIREAGQWKILSRAVRREIP
jgi:3-phenylpropionate/cinnamic acid dioxygenase small subunit